MSANAANYCTQNVSELETRPMVDDLPQEDEHSPESPGVLTLDEVIVALCLRDGLRRVSRLYPDIALPPSVSRTESIGDTSYREPDGFAFAPLAVIQRYTPYYSWSSEVES